MAEITETKRCCSSCDARKLCHICKTQTLYACSDCRIDLGVTVYVCNRASCQDAHEQKCGHSLREKYARLSELKDTLVEALNGMNDLFREAEGQSVFVIRKLGGGITNGDQDRIDAVITKLDAALSAAALFEQEKGTK